MGIQTNELLGCPGGEFRREHSPGGDKPSQGFFLLMRLNVILLRYPVHPQGGWTEIGQEKRVRAGESVASPLIRSKIVKKMGGLLSPLFPLLSLNHPTVA